MLDAIHRRTLARFVASFAVLLLAWAMLAPLYTSLLVAVSSVAAPWVEQAPGARWQAEDTRVVALRPVPNPDGAGTMTLRQGLWNARLTIALPLLAAAILATPGFAPAQRRRALVLGTALLALTQVANLLVNARMTQERTLVRGGVVLQHGLPLAGQAALHALSYFFDTMGSVFFTIAIYSWLVSASRRQAQIDAPRRARFATRSAR
jgi:hypothetical protein